MKPFKYYYCLSKDETNADAFILSTETLNFARVFFYKSYREVMQAVNETKSLCYAIVPGFNIVLYYSSNLYTGSRIKADPSFLEKLDLELKEMASFFNEYKIMSKEKWYGKNYSTALNP
jgi:hypothetical protein